MRTLVNHLSKPSRAVTRYLLTAASILMLVATAVPAGAEMPDPGNGLEPQVAPLNPQFLAHLEEPSAASYGYVPPPFDLSHVDELGVQALRPAPLPSKFDWRDQGKVTPIKDQNPCGMCWGFGTTSVLESAVLMEGGATHDFSEQSVGLCMDRSWTYLYDAWDDPCSAGGNTFQASEVFIKKGAVSESCNPYDTSALQCDGTCVCDSCPAVKMVDGVRFVTYDGSQIATIKNAVYENGPVTVSYFHDNANAYEYTDPTYGTIYDYYPNPDEANHLVSIVGWNDDVPHPNPVHGGSGAWIVKNSWGTGWGNNGYFYLAYDSSHATEIVYLRYTDANPDQDLLYHDEAGLVGSIGSGSESAWIASVFTPTEDKAVTHVDFWTTSSNAEYEITIWEGSFGSELAHQTGSCQELGYYSIPLRAPVVVPGGQEFTVAVKMTTPGYDRPIPVEYQISDLVDPPIQSGVSFARPTAAHSWDDLADYGYNASLRARVEPVAVTSRTWSGSINGDWHTAGNWTPSGVPSSSDDVTIPDVANDPIISGDNAAVDSLTVEAGAVLDLTNRTLTVEGTLTNTGTLRQTRGVTAGSTTDFLQIKNLAGTETKYYGVDITPSSVGGGATSPESTTSPAMDIKSGLQPHGAPGVPSAPADGRVLQQAPRSTPGATDGPARGANGDILYSIADACVLEGYPSENLGSYADMWAGYDELLDPYGRTARSLVKFDLSSLPSGQQITEATLWLYLVGSWDYPDTSRTIQTYRATSYWSENSVTWNNGPGFGEEYGYNSILSDAVEEWYAFDVTDLVRAWYDGTYTNHGIMIRGPEVLGWRAFGTRESDFVPELEVSYADAPSNNPPHQPHSPTPGHGATGQSVDANLGWTGGDPDSGDTVTYDVYLDADDTTPTTLVCEDETTPSCDPGTLDPGTQYFWYVVATDSHDASTTGDTWRFTTETGGTDVTVSVSGDQFCAGRTTGVRRCFDVAPQTQMDATVRFYFREVERGGLALQDLLAFRHDGTWTEEPGPYTRGGGGEGEFVEVENVGGFSVFALDAAAVPSNDPPLEPSDPSPSDGDTGVSTDVQLSWTGGDPNAGDTVTYDIYLDADDPTPTTLACEGETDPSCDPGTLDPGTLYFWYVVATDNDDAATEGEVWYFTTAGPSNTPPTLSGLPDQEVPVNGSAMGAIDLWAYASDAEDADDELTFAISNVPAFGAGVSIAGNRYVSINPVTAWTGETEVEVQVEDSGGLTDTDSFWVTVSSNTVYLPLVLRRWPPYPDTPVLNPISNPDGGGDYTVSWGTAYLADTYVLQEADNAEWAGPATVYSGPDTSWNASDKEPGTYYYRVKAQNTWGSSGWSSVQSVEVQPQLPGTLRSIADACVLEGYPDENVGDTSDMWAGYDDMLDPNGKVVRSLIRFDVSPVPSDASIEHAILRLYLVNSWDYPDKSRTIKTYRVDSGWSETSVTWNTRPSYAESYGSTSVTHGDSGWYSFDVTGLVRGWVNESLSNQGVMLRGPERSGADSSWKSFSTREGPHPPQLVITYSGSASSDPDELGRREANVEPAGTILETLSNLAAGDSANLAPNWWYAAPDKEYRHRPARLEADSPN